MHLTITTDDERVVCVEVRDYLYPQNISHSIGTPPVNEAETRAKFCIYADR